MITSIKESIYYALPLKLQNYLVSAYGKSLYNYRYTAPFENLLEQINSTAKLTGKQIEDIQFSRLLKMLTHARDYVPYYNKLFKEFGINIQKFQDLNDIHKIPVLEKDQFRNNIQQFYSSRPGDSGYFTQTTSGSTGTPLTLSVNEETYKLAMALLVNHEQMHGVEFGRPRATFAGRMVKRAHDNKPPFSRYNKHENQLLFSSYHINKENVSSYVYELNNFRPEEIIGYPSSIYELAYNMKVTNNSLSFRPKLIVTNSETLLDWQRDTIEEVLSAPVRDYYGTAEYVIFASQCDQLKYHINPLVGLLEIVNSKDQPTIDEEGDVIATSLTNYTMPLIRYRIGDRAVLSAKPCGCGLNSSILDKIEGRVDDLIITQDNLKIGRLDHIYKNLTNIKEGQILQVSRKKCIIKIVRGSLSDPVDVESLISNFHKRVGTSLDVDVEFVDSIPRGKNGKFKAVLNLVESQGSRHV